MDTAALHPAPPANANDTPELQDSWRDHCLRMAHSTEALAKWCDEPEMLDAYLSLAAQWKAKAARP